MKRPDLGKLAVGDEVFVIIRGQHIPARVAKVGRVWVDLDEIDDRFRYPRSWRMRQDTQADGSGYGSRFVTPAQHDWEARHDAAEKYLEEQGIAFRYGSPWDTSERRIMLAAILKNGIKAYEESAGKDVSDD